MLNTNQSNQRKSWKYALILPVLSAFMLLFQIETVAQVKENSISIDNTATKAVAVAMGFVTDKNATDAEMESDSKELKKQGIDYKFSKIKRNKKGEIIAIKIEFNDNNGNKGVKAINGKDPIEPIYFSTENGKIGFTSEPDLSDYVIDEKLSKQFGTEVKVKKTTVNGVENIGMNWDDAVKLSKTKVRDYEFVTTTFDIYDLIDTRFQMKNEIINKNEKALFYYNDKEISIKDAKKLDGNSFIEITQIFPDTKMITKYGEKGKNGVVKINSEVGKPNSERNKLYIINGKEYLHSEIPKGTTVEVDGSITDLSIEEGIKKYGQKAKDGVLIFNGKSTFVNDIDNQDLIKLKSESIILNHNLPNIKTFTLSNGYQVVVTENKRIKIPEYPTTILSKVPLYFNDKNISESDFIKMNYNDIKSIKINKVDGTSGKDLRVKEIYFYSK